MAQKKDAVQQTSLGSSEDVILGLYKAVALRDLSMPDAAKKLRDYINALPEEKQEEVRGKAREYGRLLAAVAEAFLAELTVIGAGQ